VTSGTGRCSASCCSSLASVAAAGICRPPRSTTPRSGRTRHVRCR
jgi:hypothetical protein